MNLAASISWSLLGHACLVLALVLPRPVPFAPDEVREIPIEVVMTGPPPHERLAAPAEPAVMLERRAKGADTAIATIAPGGGTSPTLERSERRNLQSLAVPPSGSGQETIRAIALPHPEAMGSEALGYQHVVGGMLERAKRYPESAQSRGAKGVAAIGFALDISGSVAAVFLLRSSGEADLDSEGMALVRRAAPYPPPPPGAKRSFAIEVAFGMGERAQPSPLH